MAVGCELLQKTNMHDKLLAIIFDLDGTVLDNEDDWEQAFSTVVRTEQFDTSILVKYPFGWWHEPGIGLENNWQRIVARMDPKPMVDSLVSKTHDAYLLTERTADTIRVRDGVENLIEYAKQRGCLTALATGTGWNVVEEELEQLNLVLAFDVTTTGEEVLVQKPDPEIYILTAQKMGVDPTECLVIEDSLAGVRSALEAGCNVVGLVSTYAPADELEAAGANWVVQSIDEVAGLLDTEYPVVSPERLVE